MTNIRYMYRLTLPNEYDTEQEDPKVWTRESDSVEYFERELKDHITHHKSMGFDLNPANTFLKHTKLEIQAVITSDWEEYTGQDKD